MNTHTANIQVKDERTRAVIDAEWAMFQDINRGLPRAACQDDHITFVIMRAAQFEAWPARALASYRESLAQAAAAGRNLVALKYIYMMASTDPDGYRSFQNSLPVLPEETLALIEEIMALLLSQTKDLAARYPAVFRKSRPIGSEEEDGWPSIETYQRSELMTYPAETLRELKKEIEARSESGVSYPEQILENTVRRYGYASLSDAEAAQR